MKLEQINLCDLSQFENGCPHPVFDFLRKEAPVWFHPGTHAPAGEGFWVISKYKDVKTILKDHLTFSSETGYGARTGGGTILEDLSTDEGPSKVLPMTDPPKHDDVRLLVNHGFFPKTLQLLEGQIRQSANRIIDNALAQSIREPGNARTIDFVNHISAVLPLEVICRMGGIPEEDWNKMPEWADAAIKFAARDPQNDNAALYQKAAELGIYALGLVEKIRKHPDDSVMSQIIHAEIPGENGQPRKLDELELIRFFAALVTGGIETTRNAMAHGLYTLLQHPEQLHAVLASPRELVAPTVEEMTRWSSPVHFNRRTAAFDTEFEKKLIKRGDKVTVWYSSANRDEEVFPNPHNFDIFRDGKPHIAFGFGIHHCIGAALARMEMNILFEEFFARMQGKKLSAATPIKFLRSNRHQSVAVMRITIA